MKWKNKRVVIGGLLAGLASAGCTQSGGRLQELPPVSATPATSYRDAHDPALGAGPQGSSRLRPGEDRYDRVGYAGYAGDGAGVYALSVELPVGSFAEVTAIDSGRTILIHIRGAGSSLLDLSAAAAAQLGVSGTPPVRVRRVTVTPQDRNQLTAGQAVPARADAPNVLLTGLRRKLAETQQERPAPAKPPSAPPPAVNPNAVKTPPRNASVPPAGPRLFVQIAALSNAENAHILAQSVGGLVRPGGNIYRVQIGPYADRVQAERARSDIARRGFADARIITIP